MVIRLSSIGDIVLTSPVVRCLKQQVEGAVVHFVTKTEYAPLLKANPYIDKLHLLEEKLDGLLDELEAENFDYIIDLHQNLRSNRIKRRLPLPAFTVKKLNLRKWLLVNWKINRMPDQHIVDRYLDTLSVFDVVNDGRGLDYFIPAGESFDLKKLPAAFQDGYLAFILAGTYATKRLPPEKITKICRRITCPVVLLGGKQEAETGEEIAARCGPRLLNLAGKTTLSESASLVKEARLVLTNDTGLMHMAAAFQKKILSFWGNTVPEFGMTPYLPDPASKIMQVENLGCRPCSKLGFERCPKKHFRCMNDLAPEVAVEWVDRNY